MSQTVFVGMSGGVDSSLTAAVLKEEGYEVVGVYMKNWSKDIAGFACPWREDLADAKRVAVQLGIDFRIYDFENEYKSKVVDYMLEGYNQGITPNPDIMCNQEIKFQLFLETALADGAELIATGHYARTKDGQLYKGLDESKDQSYFLYRTQASALAKTLFPLGRLNKKQVRQMAAERKLITAAKKESMGICFVGKVGIKDFLKSYIDTSPGPILNEGGKTIGQHDGAIFYTIGQRHGLELGGGLPYYVIDKNMDDNSVTVTTDINNPNLWQKELKLIRPHWIGDPPKQDSTYEVRLRHRGELINASIEDLSPKRVDINLSVSSKAVSPGQSAVIYDGDRVVGGGIVSK